MTAASTVCFSGIVFPPLMPSSDVITVSADAGGREGKEGEREGGRERREWRKGREGGEEEREGQRIKGKRRKICLKCSVSLPSSILFLSAVGLKPANTTLQQQI